MKGVTVSIDRIVIDFTGVNWDFFNELHKRICHFYGLRMTVGERRFQYRIRINTGEHFLHISYKLIFAPRTQRNTLRIEAYPKSLVYFRQWLDRTNPRVCKASALIKSGIARITGNGTKQIVTSNKEKY